MSAWIQERFQTYARASLLAGLLVMAAIRLTATNDVFNLSKITTIWVAGVASASFCMVLALQRRRWMPRLRLIRWGLPFAGAMVLATAFSFNWRVSLLGVYGRYDGLIPHLSYGLLALVVVGLYWEKPLDLEQIARAFVLAVVVVAAVVLLQKFHQEGLVWMQDGAPSTYPVGTLGNSDFAGAFLGMGLPFCLYALRRARHPETRAILVGVVALDVVALWFTSTRGGLVAAVAGVSCLLIAYRSRFPRWTKVAAVAVAGLVALVALVDVAHPGLKRAPRVFSHIPVLRSETLSNRVQYWTAAVRIFEAHPVLGTGLSTFYESYPKVRAASEGAQYGLNLSDEPHNVFLQYAADAGVLGLASYLALFGAAIWYALRRLKGLEGAQRDLLIAFLAALLSYLAQSFFLIDVPPLAVVPWVALGAIACLADPVAVAARAAILAQSGQKPRWVTLRHERTARRSEAHRRVDSNTPIRWFPVSGIVITAGALLALGVRPLVADHTAHVATERLSSGNTRSPDEQVAKDLQAARTNPLEATYPLDAGTVAQTASRSATSAAAKGRWLSQAARYYRAALHLQPDAAPILATLAQVYTEWAVVDPSQYPSASSWWKRAIADDPTDWQVHERYAAMLAAWVTAGGAPPGTRDTQIHQLQLVAQMRPTDVDRWLELAGAYRGADDQRGQAQALRHAAEVAPSNTQVRTLIASVDPKLASAP